MTPLLPVLSLAAPPAHALSLELIDEEAVADGVTVRVYRAADPDTDVYVADIALCDADLRVAATAPPSSNRTPSSWGDAVGAILATNGDFYRSGPGVYGDAVGDGVPWPRDQTGLDRSGDWYHEKYGWVAFLHDGVTFTHTEWVKDELAPATGWAPDTVAPEPPPGTLALVSGFPELVVDGAPIACSSPTASDCFPDRSDMRARHPRTAMGLTADLGRFLLVVVDGRTTRNRGMYGAELAALMGELGAHTAFNLDGGGSSQMWTDSAGTINDYSGNNGGGSARSVANHWGVLLNDVARPGHCATSLPCDVISPGGGFIDDQGDCFHAFGDDRWWRSEAAGFGGHLLWTNAFESDLPENWAWWRVSVAEAGDYEVSVWVEPDFGVHAAVGYEVRAATDTHVVTLDQSAADGWTPLGTFAFDAGGEQWVAVFDDSAVSLPSDQHITVDAVRLTRAGAWCGDGVCEADERCACDADCPVTDEVPGNGEDDDCDGAVDEADGGGGAGSGSGAGGGAGSGAGAADGAATGSRSGGSSGCAVAPASAAGALAGLVGLAVRRRRRG